MSNVKGKIFEGTIVALPTPKTVIVAVESVWRHPIYKKTVRRTRRFAVHNESFTLGIGDKVKIQESRPLSRTKHFIIFEKVT